MFWLLYAAHGKYVLAVTLFCLPFPGAKMARVILYNIIHAIRPWDCVVGFALMELSV